MGNLGRKWGLMYIKVSYPRLANKDMTKRQFFFFSGNIFSIHMASLKETQKYVSVWRGQNSLRWTWEKGSQQVKKSMTIQVEKWPLPTFFFYPPQKHLWNLFLPPPKIHQTLLFSHCKNGWEFFPEKSPEKWICVGGDAGSAARALSCGVNRCCVMK